MIPKECKRLAEVDFPIAVVSKHAAQEKEARVGHIPKIHIWPAARPTGACRAVLLGLLLPDPCDRHCPPNFKQKARQLLPKVQGMPEESDQSLRKALLKFTGDFSSWDLSTNSQYLAIARGLVRAAHSEETPLVVDPFAGGGAIPLEALRLDCEAFASELNPVACLILKVLLQDIPGHGTEVTEELRKVAARIKAKTEKELSEFYPLDEDGSRPVAYIWARTVRCEAPNCGAEIPVMRSFWLSKKGKRRHALRYEVNRSKASPPLIEFETFEPKSDRDLHPGTISRAKARCLACGTIVAPERVCAQLLAQKGGADVIFDEKGRRLGGARLLAVVTLKNNEGGRFYRLSTERDYQIVWKVTKRLEEATSRSLTNGLNPLPDEPLPPIGTLGFRVQRYGMLRWGDLFTARQKLALLEFAGAIREEEIAENCKGLVALCFDKMIDMNTALCMWQSHAQIPAHMMSRYAIPMNWDFAEAVPIAESSGSITSGTKRTIECMPFIKPLSLRATVDQADACSSPLPDDSASIWFTDPPYYDAVPYADLTDFFFVWLKRTLPGHPLLRDPFDPQNPLTPKIREIVQDETKVVDGRPKDRAFFEEMMAKAFTEGRRVLKDDGIGCVVFAHKTTEGWEALLSGMIQGGWVVTGSWPIATEMGSRLRARESAALATSIHLVCRPRPENAPIGDWGAVLRELPKRVGDWMERLQSEGVRGADLVFACIGPALEIFSRYSKVETAEGREVGLPEYLEKVWEVVGPTALEHVLGTAEARARNSMAGALEEDARLTALFLWTLQSTNVEDKEKGKSKKAKSEEYEEERDEGEEEDEDEKVKGKSKKGYNLVFDVVRRFAQPLGIHLEDWEGRIIETEKGVVRLLSVTERAKQLFGEDGAEVVADQLERSPERVAQLMLFPDRTEGAVPEIKVKGQRQK